MVEGKKEVPQIDQVKSFLSGGAGGIANVLAGVILSAFTNIEFN